MEDSTFSHQPKSSSYVYKNVPHVEYPPLASPFEVSPAPDLKSGSNILNSGSHANGSKRLTQLSYGVDVVPKSYMPFQSTMEFELPSYNMSNSAEGEFLDGNPVTEQANQRFVTEPPLATLEPRPEIMDSNSDNIEEWRHGLFDCLGDSHTFLGVTFCMPCLVGRTSSLLRQQAIHQQKSNCWKSSTMPATVSSYPPMQEHEPRTLDYVNSACLLFSTCSLLTAGIGVCFYNFSNRSAIRERYGIQRGGDDFDDACVSFCCLCCAVGQQDLEVKSRILNSFKQEAQNSLS